MPQAIKAIETFGRKEAFLYFHVLAHLAQTEATVDWAIKELHREEDQDQGNTAKRTRKLTAGRR
jgi:hypothetical protein